MLYHIIHSSQVKDTNGLTQCRNKPSCVSGMCPGFYRYCHRRNKPIVAWPHFTRVWAALLALMMRVWPMHGEKYMGSYHVLQSIYARHLWHYRQGQKPDYMYEHMASDGSLNVVNLLTICADTKLFFHVQLSCAPIWRHWCWAFLTL